LSAVALAVVALSAAAWAALGNNPIKLVVNGQEIKPEVPPQIINERVVVPVRWVAEALGAHVEWGDRSNTVKITPGGPEQSEIDLISNYLRQAAGPKQFVENFTRALQNRNN